MKKIDVSELKDGMMFDQPVYIDGENLLVPPNLPIKQKDIDRLIKWGIEEIETEGNVVSAKDETPKKESPARKDNKELMELLDAQADDELLDFYYNAVDTLDEVFTSVRNNDPVETDKLDNIISDMIPLIKDQKDELISFLILSGRGEAHMARSSINSTILSVFIAQSVKMTAHRINQMAFGALLHDIGMMKIPEPVLQKKEKLTENELKVIQTHPIYSYKIITKILKYPEEVGKIALQHHERWDGKGYPNGLAGEQIGLPSRILTVTDAFEAMVSVRPYRNSMVGYKAMRQLLNDNSRRFDSRVLKTFIKIMGIYPIGSIVLLNDASIGRVISTQAEAPLRPEIKLLVDAQGNKYTDEDARIKLMDEKSLFIAKAININEISDEM